MRILFLVMTLFSFASHGGGSTFPVTVDSLSVNNHKFLTTLIVADGHSWDEDDCRLVNVSGVYDAEKWAHYKGRPMNIELHEESLRILAAAQNEGTIVRFGYFGNGLHRVAKCSYLSKGLFLERGYIYSIHNNI